MSREGIVAPSWEFLIYTAGESPRARRTISNLQTLCKATLAEAYRIDIIDLLEHPELASRDQVVAIPTVVRRKPTPIRKLVGDLSVAERVVMEFEMHAPQPSRLS